MSRESLVVETLVELADGLVDNFDVVELLTVLSDRCTLAIDVDAAGVMLATPSGELQYIASSSESMRMLELFQVQAEEGPCIDCYNSGAAIINHELATGELWPNFTPRALAQGFRAVHCLPLRLRGRTIGALNLFRVDLGPMNDSDVAVAQGFADVATIAVLQHRSTLDAVTLSGQLAGALNSRIVIEQAKGMIAQAANCDMDVAFSRLRTHSRNHNLNLTLVAQAVVKGELTLNELDVPTTAKSLYRVEGTAS